MEKLVAQGLNVCEACQRRTLRAEGIRHWTVGLVITLVVVALFAIAAILAVSSVRDNNTRCLQQVANDEHVSLDAFFQNPSQQDALAEATTLCSH